MKIHSKDFRVQEGDDVDLKKWPTMVDPVYKSKEQYQQLLTDHVTRLSAQQQLLYASNHHAILLIFQAMDAAGKDGAIQHVMSGVNPQGCQVFSFKHPSATELQHDFLWRTTRDLPERGRIGIFNRSYYEEVLIVRVHRELLLSEGLPDKPHDDKNLWHDRYRSITNLERHLHANGTRIVKFFLHLSKDEQRERFLARIDQPEKNWKFSTADIQERKYWKDYMNAYEACLGATSTSEAPWFVVPADDKENARLIVSQVVLDTLEELKMSYPQRPRRAEKNCSRSGRIWRNSERGEDPDIVRPSKTPTEVELKFLLLPRERPTIARNLLLVGATMQTDLSSVYYDTPDWTLRKQGLTLRVRRMNGAFVQTVKREAGSNLFDRDEWETKICSAEPDCSALAGTPAEDILCANGADTLVHLFGTEVRRTSRIVNDGFNKVEISLDHGKIVAGAHRQSIDELELELKRGDGSGLFAIARRFAGNTGLRLSFESKVERGYRLAAGETPAALNAAAVHIRGDMTGAEAFTLVMRTCLAQICGNANLLSEARNPEALHQLRVGLRRLNAAFAIFRPILPGKELAKMRAEIKWMGGELDTARDLDVFVQKNARLANDEGEDDARSHALVDRLGAAQTASYDRALAAVNSKRFATLMLNCSEWVEVGSWRHSRDKEVGGLRRRAASALGAAALDRLSRKLRKAGKHLAVLDPPARHHVRIKAKKLRYAAEFFAEAFGHHFKGRRSKFIASLARLQDTLGNLNDLTIGHQTLLEAAGKRAALAFRAEHRIGEHDRDEGRLLRKAVRAYNDWRQAKAFWR